METCGQCGERLPEGGVSLYFCGPECQRTWLVSRERPQSEATILIAGYRIPRNALQRRHAERDEQVLRGGG